MVRDARPARAARDGPGAGRPGRSRLPGRHRPDAGPGGRPAPRPPGPGTARTAQGLGYPRRPPQSVVGRGPFVLPFGRPARQRKRASGGSPMIRRNVAATAATIVLALPAAALAQLGARPVSSEGLPSQEHYRLRLEYREWRPELTGSMLKSSPDLDGTVVDLNDGSVQVRRALEHAADRKSTRLNSS